MKIESRELTKEDIGSKVTYIPSHAEGNASYRDCRAGTIALWNDHYIFVDYGLGTNHATRPQDLAWG